MELKKRTVELIVAEGCNLKCAYCFEHFKRPVRMEFPTAKEAVDRYLTSEDGVEEVTFEFMGGEPMISYPLIRRVVEYVESRDWPKAYHFSMSTNGTLFSEKNKSWFIQRKDTFTPMLSLDGTKYVHDLNRSGSYDRVMENIDFFREHWPFQTMKMTVNDRSLPHLADGVLSILALGAAPGTQSGARGCLGHRRNDATAREDPGVRIGATG